MSYTSDIDIKLGETPKVTDHELLPDMVDVYNAIHILAQYTDQLREYLNREEGDPWETFPLDNTFWTGPAREKITKGDVIHMNTIRIRTSSTKYREEAGVYRGVGVAFPRGPTSETSQFPGGGGNPRHIATYVGVTGLAVTSAAVGKEVRMAVGPGIIESKGIKLGEPVVALNSYTLMYRGYDKTYLVNRRSTDGKMYRIPDSGMETAFAYPGPALIGVGVAKDALYINPAMGGGFVRYTHIYDPPHGY